MVSEDLGMNERNISMEELLWAIKKLKRGKAAGPDGIPVDVYKEMNEHQLVLLLNLINKSWNGEALTEEATRAQVVLIFKKGNKADLGNYRPISLLNSNYKIYTAIFQKRLADVLDTHIYRRRNMDSDARKA